eukprot:TRINITY_DN1024_c2_g1_i1.p1 TRINITY_DN1024_c2_g1~~TRINITY_DN1024_c2_g1_i1.p1  ORF type:complete len:216 (-),score=88.14 TRINITY_DN1024_c2_g1_i1:210-857(-)
MFFFTCSDPDYVIYMGKDKYENEELIKYGLECDYWFHVSNLSSAHVYLRCPEHIESIDDIPSELVKECSQLVKANSIQGCKKKSVDVVYTPWSNLKKTVNMVAGEVGYYDEDLVYNVHIAKKINAIINRLNKTKTESFPNLAIEQQNYIEEKRQKELAEKRKQAQLLKEKKQAEKKKKALLKKQQQQEEKEMEQYMVSNNEYEDISADDFEDNFL